MKEEEYQCYKTTNGKLKILVDENILNEKFIKVLRKKFNVKKAIKNRGLDDKNVMFGQAKKDFRVILTKDNDFWNDNKFPMNKTTGIIIITTQDIDKSIIALKKFLHTLDVEGYDFSRSCNHWWNGIKVRIRETGYTIKSSIFPEEIFEYEK